MRSRRRSSPAVVYGSPPSPPLLMVVFCALEIYGIRSTSVPIAPKVRPLYADPPVKHSPSTSTYRLPAGRTVFLTVAKYTLPSVVIRVPSGMTIFSGSACSTEKRKVAEAAAGCARSTPNRSPRASSTAPRACCKVRCFMRSLNSLYRLTSTATRASPKMRRSSPGYSGSSQ